MKLDMQTVGTFFGVLAILSAIADLLPNSPFRLKDLNAPKEDWASTVMYLTCF
ncbi:MAG: hypothetical protein IPI39_22055 [Candidatus Obscuribacter sp.]|nr:hypothetical protein [Candidatus Obscuribacter sp.]